MNEFTDQLPLRRNRISGDMVFEDEIADQLGSNRFTGDMVFEDEIADEMTEILHVKTLFKSTSADVTRSDCVVNQINLTHRPEFHHHGTVGYCR